MNGVASGGLNSPRTPNRTKNKMVAKLHNFADVVLARRFDYESVYPTCTLRAVNKWSGQYENSGFFW